MAFAPLADANVTIDSHTNHLRAEHGLRQLHISDPLHDVAWRRAREISRDFSHDFDWMYDIGQWHLCGVGENIAYRNPAADQPSLWAFNAWVNSPTHLENMLGRWSATGSAVYIAPNGAEYAVQVFVLRRRSC